MAYTRQEINDLFSSILTDLDISADMFNKARAEYEALGAWIDKESDEYAVKIYPQGSFALGTVIKPISGKDDYDLPGTPGDLCNTFTADCRGGGLSLSGIQIRFRRTDPDVCEGT